MHFPMRCFRSDSQRAGRAAVTGAFGGTAGLDKRRHGAHVAWRKGVDRSVTECGRIRGQGIAWKMVRN